ncbi:MAG: hypothetical protein CVV44_08985 [Spirochaetae bacterium HGW-Spirochaetae-1]|nr:MAG: hypothetical protein CVV44_08985 [Spirochaetae bacterium HGW-Spirochaetae-1]
MGFFLDNYFQPTIMVPINNITYYHVSGSKVMKAESSNILTLLKDMMYILLPIITLILLFISQ